MKPEPPKSQIIKEGYDPGEEPVKIHPDALKAVILIVKYIAQFILFLGLLMPWCSGAQLVSGAIILAWFSQQLNNLKK